MIRLLKNFIIRGGWDVSKRMLSFALKFSRRYDYSGNKINNIYSELFNATYDNFFNYKVRPKYSNSIVEQIINTDTKPGELAIVIQGLPELKEDFTLETIRIYKKIFPGALLIVSTWDTVSKDILELYENEGCVIVINKSFTPCGYGNVNYQICTTLAGIRRAKELGAIYTIKNRSDQRIYKPFAFEYLKSLLQILPVNHEHVPLKGRIVTVPSGGGQMFNPFYLQDFFYFGYTDDLLKLFDIQYDNRNIASSPNYLRETYKPCSHGQMCDSLIPEVYIIKKFLEKYITINETVKESWSVTKDLFIIIDDDDLNLYWPKYNMYSINERDNSCNGFCTPDSRHQQINFTNFINIKCGRFIYEEWMENSRYEINIFE